MCGKSCAKFILYFVNLIFVLVGAFLAALGGLGIWNIDGLLTVLRIVPQLGQIIQLLEDTGGLDLIKNSSIAFLVIGGVLFVIGFLGCCGAKGEYKILLMAFAIILGVMLAAELALIIYVVVDRDGIQTRLEGGLNRTLENNYIGQGLQFNAQRRLILSPDTGSAAWDAMHMTIRCCGSTGHTDFADIANNWNRTYPNVPVGDSSFTTIDPAEVPLSCCAASFDWNWPPNLDDDLFSFVNVTNCLGTADEYSTYQTGCVQGVFDAADRQTTIVFAVIGSIMALQLLEIILACCIMKDTNSVV